MDSRNQSLHRALRFPLSRRKRASGKDGRGYLFAGLEGQESKEQEQKLVVIPHYKLWNPEDERTPKEEGGLETHPAHNLKFPYQSRKEPLSREAWITGYRTAAPHIQRLMDVEVEHVKEWGPKATQLDCTTDIAGVTQKLKVFRRECIKHQSIVNTLAPKTPFEPKVSDGKGGFIPVQCQMTKGGMCKALNCYSEDVDVLKSIVQLKEREKTCRKALGLLVQDEEANGPADPEAEVTAHSGGRLEGGLPSPDKSALPVDQGLALLAAIGAVSSNTRGDVTINSENGSGRLLSRGGARRADYRHQMSASKTVATEAFRDFLCSAL